MKTKSRKPTKIRPLPRKGQDLERVTWVETEMIPLM